MSYKLIIWCVLMGITCFLSAQQLSRVSNSKDCTKFTNAPIAQQRHVFIHAGVNVGRDTEKFLIENPKYVPYLFEPNPMFADRLQALATRFKGEFHARAVWIKDDEEKIFDMHRSIFKNGVGGGFYQPTVTRAGANRYVSKAGQRLYGRFDNASVPDRFTVKTIDLSNFIKKRLAPSDIIVLRMDIEGAEYEVFRKLLIDGLLCRFERIEYEAHAMFSKENFKFKAFDAAFPWIVSACGTEVEMEAMHLAGSKHMEEIFDKNSLTTCERCGLPVIGNTLGEAHVSQFRTGWWSFKPTGFGYSSKSNEPLHAPKPVKRGIIPLLFHGNEMGNKFEEFVLAFSSWKLFFLTQQSLDLLIALSSATDTVTAAHVVTRLGLSVCEELNAKAYRTFQCNGYKVFIVEHENLTTAASVSTDDRVSCANSSKMFPRAYVEGNLWYIHQMFISSDILSQYLFFAKVDYDVFFLQAAHN